MSVARNASGVHARRAIVARRSEVWAGLQFAPWWREKVQRQR